MSEESPYKIIRSGELERSPRGTVAWEGHLPQALAEQPSTAIGTVIRPSTMRALAQDAGFSHVEDVPIEDDFWRFYRLVP